MIILLEPLPRGSGVQFSNEDPDEGVPAQWVGAVEEGIRKAAETGVLASWPVVDVKATLLAGNYHDTDSSWEAFFLAAQNAFWNAMRKAGPRYVLK